VGDAEATTEKIREKKRKGWFVFLPGAGVAGDEAAGAGVGVAAAGEVTADRFAPNEEM
jgi:hypothetical protein